ncbi:octapeptide-repeat protein T2-like [Zingiber officinale]|uniref:octapeptide-repeat protein T2-like n=1 Tax=Zingiber officinale TaxID=94328 RepID=UPI001C4ACDF0|nr:octapeptide-repeat protein T2-like [Zingiber officinale]
MKEVRKQDSRRHRWRKAAAERDGAAGELARQKETALAAGERPVAGGLSLLENLCQRKARGRKAVAAGELVRRSLLENSRGRKRDDARQRGRRRREEGGGESETARGSEEGGDARKEAARENRNSARGREKEIRVLALMPCSKQNLKSRVIGTPRV